MIDASAALQALADNEPAARLRARLATTRCHSPHLFDAEVGQALRGHERAGKLTAPEASAALSTARRLVDVRHAHTGAVAQRAWQLRHSLSFYDALYVALSAALELPLLTADRRIARVPGLPCEVEVV